MLLDKVTPVDEHIAKRLRQFRIAAGMTQDQLGELTGISFQQIQKYEKAKNRVSASKLFEISQILNKPISAFFYGIKADRDYYNYNFKSDKKQVKEMKKFENDVLPLVRAFRKIENEQSKKYLIALALSIARQKRKKVKHAYS
ncbi:MAG: helix-turn-helix transcriptional regulator [Pelagibacterales bacterium]|nr:helix-turn-helix transcriptional regulator [Pelagibacterales bacterium]